jgi:hypothetical protein
MKEFREFIYNQHDVVCNQKYAGTLPYSCHLAFVEAQGRKFLHLLDSKEYANYTEETVVLHAIIAHDSIEDARITYNDILNFNSGQSEFFRKSVADIVYCVTDEKGKNRKERKNNKYYAELKKNKLAVFVKLADLAANTLFSKLSGSSMYEKYKKEWPNFKEKLYIEEYKEFFDYIKNL